MVSNAAVFTVKAGLMFARLIPILVLSLSSPSQGIAARPKPTIKPGGLTGLKSTAQLQMLEKGTLSRLSRRTPMGKSAPNNDPALGMMLRRWVGDLVRGKLKNQRLERKVKGAIGNADAYRYFLAFGKNAAEAESRLAEESGLKDMMADRVDRWAIGAAPNGPGFQVLLVALRDRRTEDHGPALTQTQLDQAMESVQPDLHDCYDTALKEDPNLRGTALFEIQVGKEGTPVSIKATKRVRQPSFQLCLEEVLQTARFDKPRGGRTVTYRYPVKFAPPPGQQRIGRLSSVQINTTMRGASDDFQTCYETARETNAELRGKLQVSMEVNPSGRVDSVTLTSTTIEDQAFKQCIKKRCKKLMFPRPKFEGFVRIDYPIRFDL